MDYLKKKKKESILYIPELSNNVLNYNMNNIYTPRKFVDTNEYIIHLENLRKLQNYNLISFHLDLLDKSVYKNIIKGKLNKLNWSNKFKRNKENELEKLNNLNKKKLYNKKEKFRSKSSLDYKGLKKVNISKKDIDILRTELKLPKI